MTSGSRSSTRTTRGSHPFLGRPRSSRIHRPSPAARSSPYPTAGTRPSAGTSRRPSTSAPTRPRRADRSPRSGSTPTRYWPRPGTAPTRSTSCGRPARSGPDRPRTPRSEWPVAFARNVGGAEVSVADYTIDRGLGVRERMDLLAAVHEPATLTGLDIVGIAAGARCVDLGCGGGHVALELARRVGPSGHVTGIDLDEELLELARAEATARGLDNVTFHVGPVE